MGLTGEKGFKGQPGNPTQNFIKGEKGERGSPGISAPPPQIDTLSNLNVILIGSVFKLNCLIFLFVIFKTKLRQ